MKNNINKNYTMKEVYLFVRKSIEKNHKNFEKLALDDQKKAIDLVHYYRKLFMIRNRNVSQP